MISHSYESPHSFCSVSPAGLAIDTGPQNQIRLSLKLFLTSQGSTHARGHCCRNGRLFQSSTIVQKSLHSVSKQSRSLRNAMTPQPLGFLPISFHPISAPAPWTTLPSSPHICVSVVHACPARRRRSCKPISMSRTHWLRSSGSGHGLSTMTMKTTLSWQKTNTFKSKSLFLSPSPNLLTMILQPYRRSPSCSTACS